MTDELMLQLCFNDTAGVECEVYLQTDSPLQRRKHSVDSVLTKAMEQVQLLQFSTCLDDIV